MDFAYITLLSRWNVQSSYSKFLACVWF